MNVGGGEAADQLVRMMLAGSEVVIRLSGSAMKNVLALSLALAKSHKRISGKVNLGKMLRETRDLRQFPMTPEQYRQFQKLAKRQKLLIQDGISADKTFLDTFWAAHTHALAMADVQTGQVISGRCYLSWPLTDKEWDAGDYSKRFAKGKVYRIMARRWKGDELDEPRWYVTQVLEEGIPCPALEELWAEYTKPVLLKDEVLGTLTLDREMSYFSGTCQWMGKEVQISLDVEIEKKASWTRVTNVMKKLVADQEVWDKSLRAMAARKLTAQANEWLEDNDRTDRDPEKDPITEDEFARRILLTEFTVSPGGRFTAWYEDDDMFWGHVITVEGTLKKGPVDADIQG